MTSPAPVKPPYPLWTAVFAVSESGARGLLFMPNYSYLSFDSDLDKFKITLVRLM